MAAPQIDPEVGCIIPSTGSWPVDPQDDQEIQEDRLWIDGCFDFFHHGHTGVMLQSRRLGTSLLVGLHSDEDILANKGPTVMNLAERTLAVEACRFATGVVPHAPYVTSLPWISHYGCRYVTHGDDITSDASGEDCYRFVKRAGRMKIVKRTEGISTTDLVGRMLNCAKEHFIGSLADVLAGREGDGDEGERAKRGKEMEARVRGM
jgi:ethanolamine-phosphate cytidylyltransferase